MLKPNGTKEISTTKLELPISGWNTQKMIRTPLLFKTCANDVMNTHAMDVAQHAGWYVQRGCYRGTLSVYSRTFRKDVEMGWAQLRISALQIVVETLASHDMCFCVSLQPGSAIQRPWMIAQRNLGQFTSKCS